MGISIYKIVNGKPSLDGYIKDDKEINEETKIKIREKYSLEDELKILRLASTDTASFSEYNDYVEMCRDEGRAKKEANASVIASLTKKTIIEDNKERIIYVRS